MLKDTNSQQYLGQTVSDLQQWWDRFPTPAWHSQSADNQREETSFSGDHWRQVTNHRDEQCECSRVLYSTMRYISAKEKSGRLSSSTGCQTHYNVSDSGWMNGDIFTDWFQNHFLIHAPAMRPLLLLLDGHSSHYNWNAIRCAAESQVIMFCLPPNTTHLLQPWYHYETFCTATSSSSIYRYI